MKKSPGACKVLPGNLWLDRKVGVVLGEGSLAEVPSMDINDSLAKKECALLAFVQDGGRPGDGPRLVDELGRAVEGC